MLDEFYTLLYDIFERFVPKSTIKPSNNPTWYNKQLCNPKNVYNRQFKKLCAAKKIDPNADSTKFNKVSEEFDKLKLDTYNKYIQEVANNSKKNPKKFWKLINGKRKSNSLPCKLNYNDKVATNDMEKANLFAEFFASVFIERPADNDLINFINERNDDGFSDISITTEMVSSVLSSTDLNKGQGPDLIPPLFLRECAGSLAVPLSVIFEKSLNDKVFPSKFKLGQVTPIYKDGKKSDISNYRGVAVVSNLAKTFELLVYNQIKMIIHPRISKKQHGAMSTRNIETNLMEFCNYAHSAFEQNAQVDTFYSDVKKAYDSVDQPRSVRKLSSFPISNKSLHWFNSYSSGSELSEQFIAHSAISQGTILGSTIFLSFFDSDDVSDLAKSLNFMDDKKKALIIKVQADTIKLQKEIDNFVQWCEINGLELNIKKCKIMTFTHKLIPIKADYYINGTLIERVEKMPDLGVLMDPKLSFVLHREFAKKKADNALGFVKRECFKSLNKENAKLLYGALVRPHLEFANVIWYPTASSHISQVESTQKQAVIFMHNDNINREENGYVLAPYRERCEDLGLISLNRRRINSAVLWMQKVVSGRIDSPDLRSQLDLFSGDQSSTDPDFIQIRPARTIYGSNAPFNNACRAYNRAVDSVDPTPPYNLFKSEVLRLPDSAFGDMLYL